jgi:OmpA-OmpF porin, OOP family
MKKIQLISFMMFVFLANSFAQEKTTFQGYEKYDFVPCENIIYYKDFLQDTLGKFPQHWLSNSPSEVLQLKQYPGINWYKMVAGSTNSTDGQITFADNTTIEWDMIANVGEDSTANIPEIQIYFHSQLPDQNLGDYVPGNGGFGIKFNGESVNFYSWKNGDYTTVSNEGRTTELNDHKNKKVHMAVCIQKSRVLFYVNQEKVIDMPDLSPEGIPPLDRISFYSSQINLNSSLMVSNLTVATGIIDYRDKLAKMGKFSTHGIKFETGSDKIKPESYPVLKEIANVINENTNVKFMIVGHTDNLGNESRNQTLSLGRAESVKKALMELFEVDAKNISTEGKGGSAPLNKNVTSEDRAINSRIEFIRL